MRFVKYYKYILLFISVFFLIWWSLSVSYQFGRQLIDIAANASRVEICLLKKTTVTNDCIVQSPISTLFAKPRVSEMPSKTPSIRDYSIRFKDINGDHKCIIGRVYEKIPEYIYLVPTTTDLDCKKIEMSVGGIVRISRDAIEPIEDKYK